MQPYIINVAEIEELQMISNLDALEQIMTRARSTIVNGEAVHLVRKDKTGAETRFDAFTTLDELDTYRESVFRYL